MLVILARRLAQAGLVLLHGDTLARFARLLVTIGEEEVIRRLRAVPALGGVALAGEDEEEAAWQQGGSDY